MLGDFRARTPLMNKVPRVPTKEVTVITNYMTILIKSDDSDKQHRLK